MTMAPQTRTAKTQTAGAGAPAETGVLAEQIRVSVPERSLRSDLRATSIVWRRELIRFRRDRLRAVTALIQPVLFLFILGTGLSSLAKGGMPPGVNFKTFIYPGVVAMSVLFTAIFSAASIVWDRGFGFLRVMMAARITQFQAFMALTQMLVMPLFFLSGALYPLTGLPGWLSVLTRIDPLTYVVGPMRHAVVTHLNISPLAQHALSPGVTWDGWVVPIWLSLGIVTAMGLAMMSIAIVA